MEGHIGALLGMLSQYVLAPDVPLLAESCRKRGYNSVCELVADAELTDKWLTELGVSTAPARRMLLRELRRLKRAEASSPSVSEPDEPLPMDDRRASLTPKRAMLGSARRSADSRVHRCSPRLGCGLSSTAVPQALSSSAVAGSGAKSRLASTPRKRSESKNKSKAKVEASCLKEETPAASVHPARAAADGIDADVVRLVQRWQPAGPSYLMMETATPSPGSDWPIPLGSVRLPTLLQSAQRRLAFALHLVSRSSFGGGAAHVRRSALEQLDLDVVELVGQLVMGESAPIDWVLAIAGLASDKAAVVERHLGLVGLMGTAFRLDALATMCFNKNATHGKNRGKWRSLVSELLLPSESDSDSPKQLAQPSVLAITTSINAVRHRTQARLRHLSEPEKLVEAKLERAVKALPTGVALREAASKGAVEELSRLIQSGSDLNSTDDTGCSALWLAAYHSHASAVAVLIEASADIELSNEVGMTALMAAACCGSADTVRVLLEAGADWRKRDTDDGRTAIDWAKSSRSGTAPDPDAVLLLQSWLLEHGTATEVEEFLNEALRQAVANGVLRTELEVRRMVASGAKVDGVDSAGRTALHLAAGASSRRLPALGLAVVLRHHTVGLIAILRT